MSASESPSAPAPGQPQPHLTRRFGLFQATALNMTNMIGTGPFITIPALMSTINGGGPQCMLGWIVGLLIVIPDSLIWAELGAAIPASGASYKWLRDGYGHEKWGRLIAFLYIWQFMISGPMEIGSGLIGLKQYLGYFLKIDSPSGVNVCVVVLGIFVLVLLYRRIGSISRITVWLWAGTMLTVGAVILSGIGHFDPKIAFSFPENAFKFSPSAVMGLGAAASIGIYDYLGYYDICYLGDEVRDPGRVIPRSILLSVISVALIYMTMNLCIIGVVPWRSFVPAGDIGKPVVSIFMTKIWGLKAAWVFTALILWTAFGSVFALALGYSRVPYAAARDGCFFRIFGRLHPTREFPHLSVLLIVALSIAFSFVDLTTLINMLVAMRIIVQFIGQIGVVMLLRKTRPDMPRPFRVWLYPLPALVALAGWIFLFVTSGGTTILGALAALVTGLIGFLIWAKMNNYWPFAVAPEPRTE